MNDDFIISGGISGGITDVYSPRAKEHAEKYYEAMRHTHSDVAKIAKNTGYNEDTILMIKNYLFIDVHNLDIGIERFSPSFEIAQSWQRLQLGGEHIKPHDLTLLKHELMEMEYMAKGLSQSEAHDITSQTYNYGKEANAFYKALGIKSNTKSDKNQNSGGIKRNKSKDDWKERC